MSGIFVDSRDEKPYGWVRIRNQIWMAANLNFAHEDSRCYEDRETNCTTYGRLYYWNTAMANSASSSTNPSGIQGICPSGWHLPSNAEWGTLMQSINPSCSLTGSCAGAGKYLKAAEGWNGVGGNGTDAYGFAAMPGGYGLAKGTFVNGGNSGGWWSATESSSTTTAFMREVTYSNEYANQDYWGKTERLYSVRCVKD